MIIEIQGNTIDTKEIEAISNVCQPSRNIVAFYIYMKSKLYFTITAHIDDKIQLESIHSQTVECFRGIKEIYKIQ